MGWTTCLLRANYGRFFIAGKNGAGQALPHNLPVTGADLRQYGKVSGLHARVAVEHGGGLIVTVVSTVAGVMLLAVQYLLLPDLT